MTLCESWKVLWAAYLRVLWTLNPNESPFRVPCLEFPGPESFSFLRFQETFQARTNFQKEKPVTAYPGTVVQPKGMSTAGKKSPQYQQTRSNPSDTINQPTP